MSMIQPIPVTAIVLTLNEEVNIAACLDALDPFDDIIIVDSGSTDKTLEVVADQFPQVRVYSNPFEDFGQQRNWALDNTDPRREWILFIDADEFMEPPLADEIRRFVQNPRHFVGAFIAGRNYFLGKWLKYSTFFPSYQLRLLKQGEVRYRREGHGQREVTDGELAYLKHSWRHEAFSQGLSHWVDRHNRYSTAEVELLLRLRNEKLRLRELLSADPITRRRAVKILASRLPARHWFRLFYSYVLRLGFLDGSAGLTYALLRLSHELTLEAKLREVRYRRKKAGHFTSAPQVVSDETADHLGRGRG